MQMSLDNRRRVRRKDVGPAFNARRSLVEVTSLASVIGGRGAYVADFRLFLILMFVCLNK